MYTKLLETKNVDKTHHIVHIKRSEVCVSSTVENGRDSGVCVQKIYRSIALSARNSVRRFSVSGVAQANRPSSQACGRTRTCSL